MLGWLYSTPFRQAITFLVIVTASYIFFSRPVEFAGDVALYQEAVYLAAGRDGIQVLGLTDRENLSLMKHIPINGWVGSVEVVNNTLFVSTGTDGIRIYDLADPFQPVEIGHYNTDGNATEISIQDNTLFIADGRSGIRFVEYSGDPTYRFSDRGTFRPRGVPLQVLAQGNRLYISDRRNFFSIVNINNLSNPTLLGEVNLRTRINKIQIIGENALLATDNNGLVILDISDPENLNDAARINYDTPGEAMDFALHANFIYLADGNDGLRVLDIEKPDRIREVGHFDTPGNATRLVYTDDAIYIADGYMGLTVLQADVQIAMRERDSTENRIIPDSISINDHYAFIAAGSQGVHVLDLSDPSAPFLINKFSGVGYASDIATEGDVGYLADREQGVIILEISEPRNEIRKVGETLQVPGETQAILSTENFLYLANGSAGISIFDKTIPAEPVRIGAYDTPGNATSLAYFDGMIYVADLEAGLRIVDASDPRAPIEVGSFDTPGEARSVQIYQTGGDAPRRYAYLADGTQGLQILDVSNPRNVRSLARLGAKQFYEQVTIRNQYLFIASRGEGILIFDLNDPGVPKLVGAFTVPLDPVDLVLSENRMYVADKAHGLRVARIDDLTRPNEIGFFDLPSGARGFVLGEDSVFLVDGQPGLWLLNRNNTGNFTLRDYIPSLANAQSVKVFGDRAYILEWDVGVEIVDLSQAGFPIIGRIDTPGAAKDIRVIDQMAYIADGVRGLLIYDISDPQNPRAMGSLDTQGDSRRLAINERYAYIADGPNGLYVARISEPDNPVRVSVTREPSDARSVTSVDSYVYVAGGESGLHIYDMTRPLVPVHITNLPTISPLNDVAILGEYAYLSLEDGTIEVLDISNPSIPEIVGIEKTASPALQLEVIEYENEGSRPLQIGIFVATDTSGLQVLSGQKTLQSQLLARHNTSGTAPLNKMIDQAFGFILGGRGESNSKAARTWRQAVFDFFIIGTGGLFLWLIVFAQFVLPTVTLQERTQAIHRLIIFMLGRHGPAVHIRNGELHQRPGEQNRLGPGVMLVDLSSAAVLIRRSLPLPPVISIIPKLIRRISRRLTGLFAAEQDQKQDPDLRVVGPGLVFTGGQFSENVYGVADIRRQVRVQPQVKAYTRDGIELESLIFTAFTIGEDPDVLKVAYIGGRTAENLHVIYLENVIDASSRGKVTSNVKRVVKIVDEIDPEDKEEIHRVLRQDVIGRERPVPFDILEPPPATPYKFNEKRVFQAVAADARNVEDEPDQKWTDLPKHVATEIFRQMIASEVYDRLYEITNKAEYPLRELKTEFSNRVRNLGILAYQFIERKDGNDFEKGQEFHIRSVNAYSPRDLETPKSLRARGIKINAVGFSELYPVNQKVTEQKVDFWRAHWEADALKQRAPLDLRANRIRNEGRIKGQRDLVKELARVFDAGAENRDALALRLLQTLENAAVNPATRQLLPDSTVNLMIRVSEWLQEPRTMIGSQTRILDHPVNAGEIGEQSSLNMAEDAETAPDDEGDQN